ncbi:leucine-rich repeat and immunoglobulin-like domain-containing nogo receptor-interacting protein 3 [Uloborus diversus]|uniref:leucine-rich repeat and immunoglobulin-like domain-containing nogo receptor-interacting protein 3 n=1 Tax=Uloborus diversus TaxID=327109 RepID=UPI0024098872|nr:leucine-rich repeat and immunoglobulin-like domain-containing nogo receptor-interacting protein 3 [Uloborus diversus]
MRVLDGDLVDHLNENLLSFSLTSTNTTEIEDGAFAKFLNMEYISVQHNHISELRRSMFPTPAKMKNRISSLPTDLFDLMPELETIGFQGNLISVIYDASFKNSLNKLTLVSLEGNPLKCNCKMLWLLKKNVPAIFKGTASTVLT